jgi:hypothetical protein
MVFIGSWKIQKTPIQSLKLNFYLKNLKSKRPNFNRIPMEMSITVTVLIFLKKACISIISRFRNKIWTKTKIIQ